MVLAERPILFRKYPLEMMVEHCLPAGYMMMSTVKYHDDGVIVGEWRVNKKQDMET